jgi:hypothetical protein
MSRRGQTRPSRRSIERQAAAQSCGACGGAATGRFVRGSSVPTFDVDHAPTCRIVVAQPDVDQLAPRQGKRGGQFGRRGGRWA